MNASPLGKVLAALSTVGYKWKRSADGYQVQCPAHANNNPSLFVCAGADGTVLVKCHSGCNPQAIVTALGLTLHDLFPGVDVNTTPRNAKKTVVLSTANGKPKGGSA